MDVTNDDAVTFCQIFDYILSLNPSMRDAALSMAPIIVHGEDDDEAVMASNTFIEIVKHAKTGDMKA